MATIPSPPTATGGTTATSTFGNTMRDALQYLLGSTMTGGGGRRGVFQGRQTVAQSLTNATWTAITLDVEDVDYDAGHSIVSNTDRYTVPTGSTGWYQVSGGVGFATNATGRRGVRYTVNGTLVNASEVEVPATAASQAFVPGRTMLIFLSATDILRLEGIQESGGALNTFVVSSGQSHLTAQWVAN